MTLKVYSRKNVDERIQILRNFLLILQGFFYNSLRSSFFLTLRSNSLEIYLG
jgi:hypothetical protein